LREGVGGRVDLLASAIGRTAGAGPEELTLLDYAGLGLIRTTAPSVPVICAQNRIS